MARHRTLLVLAAIVGCLPLFATSGQTPLPPAPAAIPTPPENPPRDGGDPAKARWQHFREMREKLEKLPPEERKKAMENTPEWRNMPPDEKAHLRFMQEERARRLQSAVDEALQAQGLQLTGKQREEFAKIYKVERRKLEEALRAEMDQHRRDRLADLQKNVAEAYRAQAAQPTPTVSPAPSPAAAP